MTISIKYVDRTKFDAWFDSLTPKAAEAVLNALLKLEGGRKDLLKPLGGGLHELRVFLRPGYRIYGTFASGSFIIVGYGTKKTQAKDIQDAKRLIQSVKRRGRSPPSP